MTDSRPRLLEHFRLSHPRSVGYPRLVDRWTVRGVLAWTAKDFAARGIDSPRLDAELLIADALGVDRVRLYMDLDRPLDPAERAGIRERIQRRRQREPVAYILGYRHLYGRRFEVDASVLIPRPDTETLIERALTLLDAEGDARVLDLCTGTGCIGISIAAERRGCRVDLTDLSPEALAIAERNAERLGVGEHVDLHLGDLFAAVPESQRYDLITANPPYVTDAELARLAPEVRDHEPRLALASGPTGFEIHRRLVEEARPWLRPGGHILVEVGAGQAEELRDLFDAAPWVGETSVHADLEGVDRVVEARSAA